MIRTIPKAKVEYEDFQASIELAELNMTCCDSHQLCQNISDFPLMVTAVIVI
jgi:hypothetical protein